MPEIIYFCDEKIVNLCKTIKIEGKIFAIFSLLKMHEIIYFCDEKFKSEER